MRSLQKMNWGYKIRVYKTDYKSGCNINFANFSKKSTTMYFIMTEMYQSMFYSRIALKFLFCHRH